LVTINEYAEFMHRKMNVCFATSFAAISKNYTCLPKWFAGAASTKRRGF